MKEKEQRRKPKRASRKAKATLGRRKRTIFLIAALVMGTISLFWIATTTTGFGLTALLNPELKLPSAGPIVAVHEMPTRPLPTPPPSTTGLPPDIELSSYLYDFGNVNPKDNVEHTFQVANRGGGDLVITQFFASCDCTTARLTAGIIPPGQEAELTIYFDPDFHQVEGRVERVVILGSNDPDEPEVRVTITAYVLPG